MDLIPYLILLIIGIFVFKELVITVVEIDGNKLRNQNRIFTLLALLSYLFLLPLMFMLAVNAISQYYEMGFIITYWEAYVIRLLIILLIRNPFPNSKNVWNAY